MSTFAKVKTTGPTFEKTIRSFVARLRMLVSKEGQDIHTDIERGMRFEKKKGRLYPRPGGKSHRASAPGQYPAVDTGRLVNSMRLLISGNGMVAEVSTNVSYAAILQAGGRRLAARPIARSHHGELFHERIFRLVKAI